MLYPAKQMDNYFIYAERTHTQKLFYLLFGVFTLIFASQLSIPFLPVPLTFQSATVILIGMAFGARYATYTIALYLAAAALGLPVLANFSGGAHYFLGPRGGYLIGFLCAAPITGLLAQNCWIKSFIGSLVTALIGATIIFTFGILWLTYLIGFNKAIQFGLMPFIISEPIKLIAVALIAPKCWYHQPNWIPRSNR